MKRRTAIRNIAIITAGTAFLPACKSNNTAAIKLKNIAVSGKEQSMLAHLTETIIPKTNNFIGASDIKSHEFVLTMIDDCTSPDEQKKFTDGLKAFDKLCHDKYGQIFTGFTAEQKKLLLTDLENNKAVTGEALNFYKTVKHYTLQHFTLSKEFMVNVRKYNMVPGGNFIGCVPLS